jgi:hypothetical protein
MSISVLQYYFFLLACLESQHHEGNTEEENNGYVVFKLLLLSADQLGNIVVWVEALYSVRPHSFLQQSPYL